MLGHLPRNGPPGQEGLSYFVRRGDLLMVFVNTMWTGLGGEGHVETTWLREVPAAPRRRAPQAGRSAIIRCSRSTASPAPTSARSAPSMRATFWNVLVEGGVLAYLCSHILAFDVQVHRGVLQVCTAGAGTAHRMPEGIEYLHCVQGALDAEGMRYQVLDTEGRVRERLSWPLSLGRCLAVAGAAGRRRRGAARRRPAMTIASSALRFTGRAAAAGDGSAQTLLSAFRPDLQMPLWIGLRGIDQRLTRDRRSRGASQPALLVRAGRRGGLAVRPPARHPYGHGPGGFLWRGAGEARWSSLDAAFGLGRGAPRLAAALVHRPRRARSG